MESRYSPACSDALPTFAACVRLIVCVKGFANAGTVIARATKSAAMRWIELTFMRVTFFPFAQHKKQSRRGWRSKTVDTRLSVRVVSPRHQVFWTKAPEKDACQYAPRLLPRGFFCLKLEQPQIRPHPYRRITVRECFFVFENFFGKSRSHEKYTCLRAAKL